MALGIIDATVTRDAHGTLVFRARPIESLADCIGVTRTSDVPTALAACKLLPTHEKSVYYALGAGLVGDPELNALSAGLAAVCKPITDTHAQYEAFNRYVCNHASLVAAEIKVVTDIGHVRGNPVFIAFLAYGDARTTIEFRPEGNRNLDRLGPMINGFAANTELAAGRLALSR